MMGIRSVRYASWTHELDSAMTRGLRGLLSTMSLDLESAGVVMGAGVYQIIRPSGCYGLSPSNAPGIYLQYEDALRSAWRETIQRLEEEARKSRAHWVIGVNVTDGWISLDPGDYQYQLQLTGTAVRVPRRPPPKSPWLSTLTMPEFQKLLLAGWAPCGISWGVAAVHIHAWNTSAFVQGTTWTNAELQGPTAGMMVARTRLEHEARRNLAETGGRGVVKMTINLSRHSQTCSFTYSRGGFRGGMSASHGILIDGRILGTSVVPFRDPVMGAEMVVDLAGAGTG